MEIPNGIRPDHPDWFIQFARNGRWGTCGGCPRDTDKHAYPEFCPDTDRYDHQLTIDSLVETYKSYTRRLHSEVSASTFIRPANPGQNPQT